MVSLHDYKYGRDKMTEKEFMDRAVELNLEWAIRAVQYALDSPAQIKKVENFHALKIIQEELRRIRKEEFSKICKEEFSSGT